MKLPLLIAAATILALPAWGQRPAGQGFDRPAGQGFDRPAGQGYDRAAGQGTDLPPLQQQQWQQPTLPRVQTPGTPIPPSTYYQNSQGPDGAARPAPPPLPGPSSSTAPPQAPSPAPSAATAAPGPYPNTWLPAQAVRLQALDKVNAESTQLTVKVGQSATFGSLTITAKACMVRPKDQPADAAALLAVTDNHPDAPGFNGWMLKDEPSVSMMEHPIYDLRVAGCT